MRSPRRLALFVVLALVLLAGGVAGYVWHVNTFVQYRDQVKVQFVHEPEGMHHIAGVVCDSGGRLRPMAWYSPPGMFGGLPLGKTSYPTQELAWEAGDRYGVVLQLGTPPEKKDEPAVETWAVIWCDASAVAVEGRSLLTGGGRVTFDLAAGRREPVTSAEAHRLTRPSQ